MSSFGDVRDYVATLPNISHGHATQGASLKDGPGAQGYALYPPRCAVLECLIEVQDRGEECAIFEFGTLNAYCLSALGMTATLAGLEPRLGWCDNESTEAGSNERARANLEHLGLEPSFVCTDRRESALFGRALLVAVDGDHSYEATVDDIFAASAMRPSAILCDDLIPTHQGVIDACQQVKGLFFDAFFLHTVNGLGVLDSTGVLREMMTKRGWQIEELPT